MPRKGKANYSPASANQADMLWGLSYEKWREISGFWFLALALLLLLALVSRNLDQRWIGELGEALASAAEFILGRLGAYVFPALLMLAAIHAFRGQSSFHPLRKILAGATILLSFCALQALYAGPDNPAAAFPAGGLVGSFLTSDAEYALKLHSLLGPVGAWVFFIFFLLLGLMLSTDFLFLPLIAGAGGTLRATLGRLRLPRPGNPFRFARRIATRASSALSTNRERPRSGRIFAANPSQADEAPEAILDATLHQPPLDPLVQQLEDESILDDPAPATATGKKKQKAPPEPVPIMQTELDFHLDDFELPPLDLFKHSPQTDHLMADAELQETSDNLERALADFGISANVADVTQGPVVARYELQLAPGIKVSKILNLENDIALTLRAKSVRIQAPIPGKAAVGIEVPNRKVAPVFFRELIETDSFRRHASPLAFALGKNISGEPVICDLASMPHLLIAGTTGSGKSVSINVIISSLLYRMPPDKVKFIMIDPKRVELNVYSEIPHLLAPVVNEPRQAAAALAWAVQQMEERLQIFSELRVRNIDSYNAVVTGKRQPVKAAVQRDDLKYMPHIVIIIDELADLMITAKNEVEEFIVRLAQMSRAAGIHMVIATQRPSVNVITGLIKANFPSRIAFRVSAKVDSRTILDRNGAENLLGHGDMLFAPGGSEPVRIQGAFLSEHEIEQLTDHLRSQNPTQYERQGFDEADLDESTVVDGDTPLPGGQRIDLDDGSTEQYETEKEYAEDPEGPYAGAPLPSPPMPGRGSSAGPTNFSRGAVPGQVNFPDITLKGEGDEDEDKYDEALRLVLETGKPSVSMIQRRLKIGFARAGRLMDMMEERGIVGPYQGSKPRDLIIDDPKALLKRLNELRDER